MKKQVFFAGLMLLRGNFVCAMEKTLETRRVPCARATVIVKPLEYGLKSLSFLGGDGSSEIFGPSEIEENPILGCFDIKYQTFFRQKKLLEFIAMAHYARTKDLNNGIGVYDCVVPEQRSSSLFFLGYVRACKWGLKKQRKFSKVCIRLLPQEQGESGAPLYK